MWPNPQETADLVKFTEKIFNGKLIFCAVSAETVFPALISRNKSDDAFSFSYFIRRLADVIHNGDRLLWSWLVEEELIKIKSGPNYPNNPNFSNPP